MKKKYTIERYKIFVAVHIFFAVIMLFLFINRKPEIKEVEKIIVDTVYVENGKTIDSLQNALNALNEEIARTTKMSVREQQAAAAVYQIKYFIDITEKRPANKTFFFGWVKRAIKEFIEYDNELKKEKI